MRWSLALVLVLFVASLAFPQELTVEDAVQLALRRNPAAKEALYSLSAQKFREKQTFSQLLPRITFDYTYTHLKEEPYVKFDINESANLPFPLSISSKYKVGEHQDVKWGVQATWPLFTGFYLQTLHEMEKIGVDVYRFKKKASDLSVAHMARVAYYTVLIAQRNLDTAAESVRQLRAHLSDAESFYKNGLVPYNDVLKAKVALARAVEDETRAKEALETAWVNFNLTIKNDDIFARHSLKSPLTMGINATLRSLPDLYRLALSERPDVKAMEKAVERARLGVRAAKSKYYPWVTVFSRYEQHGDNLLANNNEYSNRENFSVGVKVNFLVFDWFGRKYKVHEARSTSLVWESRLEQLKDRVRLEVQKAYASVQVALKNISTAKAAVAHAREDLRITRLQYSQHIASSSDVIDSETAYIEAKNNYDNALYQYHVALSELARACGLLDVKKTLSLRGNGNGRDQE
ncbi:outer membrane factor, OMF family [Thermosulfidibacter takaii ABI70S6]|uniref:Outer membrane factor, OMF family n=2 Tax=Thermosulfidibacter takaii TaxID=412593 RepID=A0A0S3QU65_THET7|nr:outer membrane factor, OMF family [Thermosulfidibacter takaii ABI70S6]